MSNFDKFTIPDKENPNISSEIDVSFLCSTCDEEVTKATIIDSETGKKAEWVCSNGHVSSMRWML